MAERVLLQELVGFTKNNNRPVHCRAERLDYIKFDSGSATEVVKCNIFFRYAEFVEHFHNGLQHHGRAA